VGADPRPAVPAPRSVNRPDLSAERRVAIEAARAAGELLREELAGARRIAYKGSPTNLVTEMDARAEALVVDAVLGTFPADAILAEERGTQTGRSGRRWIIDPLDGTTNYAHGLPLYAVSIALEVEGGVRLGVVYDPSHRDLYVAERGAGAFCNDVRLSVSATATLDRSLLATGFPYDIRTSADNNLREYAAFAVRARGVRRLGSAVLYLAWLAAGRFDGYWELRLGPWDVAAAGLMVEEAGGRLTAIDGGPLDLEAPTVLASNGNIHDEMLAVLREIRGS
jgi:myo-inositol-1(or 4)-monophosphatase